MGQLSLIKGWTNAPNTDSFGRSFTNCLLNWLWTPTRCTKKSRKPRRSLRSYRAGLRWPTFRTARNKTVGKQPVRGRVHRKRVRV